MKNWRRPYFFIIIFCFLFEANPAYCKSIFQKKIGKAELEFEFGMYYTCLSYYQSLTEKTIPYVSEKNELLIYKNLFTESLVPKFLLIEVSVYPFPNLGVFIKRDYRQLYDSANISKNFNLVKSICVGFEEPYALSIFLGNVLSFRPEGSKEYEGKGYMGFLVSAGNYHIKDNELIEDRWVEMEWKIKGNRVEPKGKMGWSFRIGGRSHGNSYIKDVFYFSIYRDRTDFSFERFSLLKNSSVEYIMDIDRDTYKVMRHLFMIGGKIPVRKPKIALELKLGFVWEGSEKYTGPLERTAKSEAFQILLRPNIKF